MEKNTQNMAERCHKLVCRRLLVKTIRKTLHYRFELVWRLL